MTYDPKMQARPTVYNGVQMRSRLEAGWAEQFDALGWPWEYEPICLAGPDGQYLPDFHIHLPGRLQGMWWEVRGGWWRGTREDHHELSRSIDLVRSHDPGAVFVFAHQNQRGGFSIQAFTGPHRWEFATICSCGYGCVSLVAYAGTRCFNHRAPWEPIDLVPTLRSQQQTAANYGYDPLAAIMYFKAKT